VLQVSSGFAYIWDNSKGDGERIMPESMALNGTRIDPAGRYRVTVNNYLAEGGDGFVAFKLGTDQLTGIYDVDALYEYFRRQSPIAPGPANRIARMN